MGRDNACRVSGGTLCTKMMNGFSGLTKEIRTELWKLTAEETPEDVPLFLFLFLKTDGQKNPKENPEKSVWQGSWTTKKLKWFGSR